MMKLSVIVPAFNAENTICQCIDSILGQTLNDYEIIIIDDGSRDTTPQILRHYTSQFPDQIKMLSVENGGQGRARNIGLEMAKGDYIGFVDSDDWIDSSMYEKLISASENEDADIVLCDVTGHFPDGTTSVEYIYRQGRSIAAAGFANNKIFRRSLISDIRFPENKLWYEDTEFTAIALHCSKKTVHISESLYHYRRGLPSTMNNNNAMKNLDILTVMQHLEKVFLPDERNDFEFLVLNHVLLDAMNRVEAMNTRDKGEVLRRMRSYVHEKIPHLWDSNSFCEESRNRRIIMTLHYWGLSSLAAWILSIKRRRQ